MDVSQTFMLLNPVFFLHGILFHFICDPLLDNLTPKLKLFKRRPSFNIEVTHFKRCKRSLHEKYVCQIGKP